MAHTAAIKQTKISDNSVLHYLVGPNPFQKGILLFNPKTRQTIFSFQQLLHELISTIYPKIPVYPEDVIDSSPVVLSQSNLNWFMEIFGSLLFLSTLSRPDLSFLVNYITLFMASATKHILYHGYRILKYL